MKKKTNIILLFLLTIACLYQSNSYAKAIGNNTAVFIVPTPPLFPAADTNNLMFGFAQFKGGFTLQDATTICTFNSIYPVSGTVNMNGGTLYLLQDLVLTDTVQLEGLGTIIGNNHTLQLCSTVTHFPGDLKLIKDLTIYLANNIDLSSSVTIQGSCSIYGPGRSLDMHDYKFVIDSNSTFKAQLNRIEGVQNVSCVDNTGHLILNNTLGCLEDDWTWSYGDITYQNNVILYSPYTFTHASDLPCMIADESNLTLDGHITYKTGRKSIGGADPLQFYDIGSILQCNECNLMITASGAAITNGRIIMNGSVQITTESTETDRGLILGNGVETDDIEVDLNAGCLVELTSGVIVYNNGDSDGFVSHSPASIFQLDTAGEFYFATTCTLPQNTLSAVFDGMNPPNIQLGTGAQLYLNGTRILIPNYADATYTDVINDATGFVKLGANDSIYITSGSLLLGTQASGAGGLISGNGNIASDLKLTDTHTLLNLGILGTIISPIWLNNGVLRLTANTYFTSSFVTSGTIDIQAYTFTKNTVTPYSGDVALTYSGASGVINVLQNAQLQKKRTYYGTLTLDCNDNTFALVSGAALIVGPSTHLTIKNAKLLDVGFGGLTNVYCMDDTGTITLDNCVWSQIGNVEWAHGTLIFNNSVEMTGPYSFNYTSAMPAQINKNTQLALTGNITYQTGRQTVGGSDPLVFADSSSILSGNQCTFVVTASGLMLTTGQLQANGPVAIDIASTNTATGLIFGDGITIGSDLSIYLNPGCYAEVTSGALTFNNVNGNTIYATSPSQYFALDVGTTFYIETTCTFPKNTLVLNTLDGIHLPTISVAPGKSINLNGTTISIPGYSNAIFTAQTSDAINFNLKTNDGIYLNSGTLISDTTAINSNNMLSGSGNIEGIITLSSGASSLDLNFIGTILNPTALNGGTLTLTNNAEFMSTFSTGGTIDLGRFTFTRNPAAAFMADVPLTWSGTSGTIYITQDMTLTSTWTIIGDVTIDCNGGNINFDGGRFEIGSSSQLTFKNLSLNNIVSNSISCTDDTGIISLDNMNWIQANDYALDKGALIFRNAVLMSGEGHTFSYLSTQTSTIVINSNLTLDNLFTFSYAPSNGATDLLTFINYTSKLSLNHVNFYITPGLNLTGGTMIFSNAPTIYADASTTTGLTLGDNTAADDMQLIFPDSSTTLIALGQLNYKNIDTNQNDIQAWNGQTFFSFSATSTLALYNNLYLPPDPATATIELDSNTRYLHGLGGPCSCTTDIIPSGRVSGSGISVCFCG